ncbi:Odorant receptor Or1 [Eumeta japonica]|uniref:Odorant receptor Or1 n=1 Tax=Eumeta variegata TaxID=151549 RepID=A0A4C1YE39_EUMVA|nr:Odorant receptor Or1 [Eumeta japonica]
MAPAPQRIDSIYFNRANVVLSVMGIMRLQSETIIYRVYRYSMVGAQYIFLMFQVYFIAQMRHDLEVVSEASYLFFTQASLCFKVTIFLLNINRFEELSAMMNCQVFKPQNEDHEKSIRQHATTIKRLMAGFMVFSQATCGLWALRPLFDNAGDRTFPFKMWMPVEPTQSPQYELGYAFQYITICISAFMYFGVDSVALGAFIFACAQLVIIKHKILNVIILF